MSIFSHFTRCYHFSEIDSTSKFLKRNYKDYNNMTFVSCDFQTAGRGRNTRTWISSSGANLLFSLLIKDEKLVNNFESLSVLSAVTIKECLDEIGLKNVFIKWPNDVYANGKKICGILLDGITENGKLADVIIGIGVNVNQDDYPTDLLRNPTSIKLELGHEIDLKKFKKLVFKKIKYNLNNIETSNYLKIAREFNYLKNQEVYCEINNEKKLVKVLGINDDNTLLVLIDDKEVSLRTGEVTFHL